MNGERMLWVILTIALALLLLFPPSACAVGEDTLGRVSALFAHPTRDFSTGPLWVWNDLLTEQQIVDTLDDLAGQQVKQVWVHPRPGLMTPYLSEDWFRMWKVALREAERLDMNVWIYDENSYPSGFAGGLVPEAMPESQGRGLALREDKQAPKWTDDLLAVFRMTDSGYEDVTAAVRRGDVLPEAQYLTASVSRAGTSPWFGGKCYVDLLYPGTTETFLALTMDAYKKELGDQFGKRIPGVFTDEPHLQPAGGFPWTDGLPQLFEQRWGYSLLEVLPSLSRPLGDWKRVRHNYFQLLLEQFIEHWSKPYYEYCEKNNLEFTGHYWEHEWPHSITVPDNMAMYAWHQRPAIDCLMNQYAEDTHAQFGNVRAVKELSSVANQMGRSRTLCEAYGAGGWDLRFEDMKRIGDWLYVLGVNTLNEHLSYVTIRGARKRDHPQSFSYHEPWWDAYHVSASYFTRLSVALSQGRQINDVLLLEPTTTAWLYSAFGANPPELDALGVSFQNMVLGLEKAQVEFDIGCEDILARNGSVRGAVLRVGKAKYHTVVVPPQTENLNAPTAALLESFVKHGGTVLCCGAAPALDDGVPSDRGAALTRHASWRQIEPEAVVTALRDGADDGLTIQRREGDEGILFHHRRQLRDGQLVFLVNSSKDHPSLGTISVHAKGVQRWDLNTGAVEAYPFETAPHGVAATFELPPSGSLLLCFTKKRLTPVAEPAAVATRIEATGEIQVRRVEPNVLVLDYVDITAGGETKKDQYVYQAAQFAFQKNGMERNPWDSAVQFRDELISKTFPAESGFEATYRFTIEDRVPDGLEVVIERPDLYAIACNGVTVSAQPGAWWLDKAFGRIDLRSAARVGENTLTLRAQPFTIFHELESVYVRGDFALKPAEKGFALLPAQAVTLGPWNAQGQPFYSAGVSYTQRFDLPAPSGRYRVSAPNWYGSVAKVIVNGKPQGYLVSPPWQCDITQALTPGQNSVEIVVVGTLKNTLGPHHGNPGLGSAWPGMFHNGPIPGPPPGAQYSTVGYGLLEPFVVEHLAD